MEDFSKELKGGDQISRGMEGQQGGRGAGGVDGEWVDSLKVIRATTSTSLSACSLQHPLNHSDSMALPYSHHPTRSPHSTPSDLSGEIHWQPISNPSASGTHPQFPNTQYPVPSTQSPVSSPRSHQHHHHPLGRLALSLQSLFLHWAKLGG